MVEPVMYVDISEDKKIAAPATSLGFPNFFIGFFFKKLFINILDCFAVKPATGPFIAQEQVY